MDFKPHRSIQKIRSDGQRENSDDVQQKAKVCLRFCGLMMNAAEEEGQQSANEEFLVNI